MQFNFSGAVGHTMQFRTLDYKGFPLGTITGTAKTGQVTLKAGKYEIYCTVDGHAQQGMVATIVVADAPPPSS